MATITRVDGSVLHTCENPNLGAVVEALAACRTKLSGANLVGAHLVGADLSEANLSGANLSRANLSRANLSRANLSEANLSEANLSEANLSGADLSGVDLSGVDLVGVDLSGADLNRTRGILFANRSDGYIFHISPSTQDGLRILAGCRDLSLGEARAHWAATRGGTKLGEESLALIDHLERMAKLAGWLPA